jgi:hypothetical protein
VHVLSILFTFCSIVNATVRLAEFEQSIHNFHNAFWYQECRVGDANTSSSTVVSCPFSKWLNVCSRWLRSVHTVIYSEIKQLDSNPRDYFVGSNEIVLAGTSLSAPKKSSGGADRKRTFSDLPVLQVHTSRSTATHKLAEGACADQSLRELLDVLGSHFAEVTVCILSPVPSPLGPELGSSPCESARSMIGSARMDDLFTARTVHSLHSSELLTARNTQPAHQSSSNMRVPPPVEDLSLWMKEFMCPPRSVWERSCLSPDWRSISRANSAASAASAYQNADDTLNAPLHSITKRGRNRSRSKSTESVLVSDMHQNLDAAAEPERQNGKGVTPVVPLLSLPGGHQSGHNNIDVQSARPSLPQFAGSSLRTPGRVPSQDIWETTSWRPNLVVGRPVSNNITHLPPQHAGVNARVSSGGSVGSVVSPGRRATPTFSAAVKSKEAGNSSLESLVGLGSAGAQLLDRFIDGFMRSSSAEPQTALFSGKTPDVADDVGALITNEMFSSSIRSQSPGCTNSPGVFVSNNLIASTHVNSSNGQTTPTAVRSRASSNAVPVRNPTPGFKPSFVSIATSGNNPVESAGAEGSSTPRPNTCANQRALSVVSPSSLQAPAPIQAGISSNVLNQAHSSVELHSNSCSAGGGSASEGRCSGLGPNDYKNKPLAVNDELEEDLHQRWKNTRVCSIVLEHWTEIIESMRLVRAFYKRSHGTAGSGKHQHPFVSLRRIPYSQPRKLSSAETHIPSAPSTVGRVKSSSITQISAPPTVNSKGPATRSVDSLSLELAGSGNVNGVNTIDSALDREHEQQVPAAFSHDSYESHKGRESVQSQTQGNPGTSRKMETLILSLALQPRLLPLEDITDTSELDSLGIRSGGTYINVILSGQLQPQNSSSKTSALDDEVRYFRLHHRLLFLVSQLTACLSVGNKRFVGTVSPEITHYGCILF